MANEEKRRTQLREAKRRQRKKLTDNGITQLNISLDKELLNTYKRTLKDEPECKNMDTLVVKALEYYLQRTDNEEELYTSKGEKLYTLGHAREELEEADDVDVIDEDTTIEKYREHMVHFLNYDPFNELALLDITLKALQFVAIKDPGNFLSAYEALQDPIVQLDVEHYLKYRKKSISGYCDDLF
jgi:metal-responsive CopG/Arc/MetJ family transcriptional regulator